MRSSAGDEPSVPWTVSTIRAAFCPHGRTRRRIVLGASIHGRAPALVSANVLLSTLWEYGTEALAEPVSIQDMIVTPVFGALVASLRGRLGRAPMRGVHLQEADEISIEGERSSVILDGETFRAETGKPIRLQSEGMYAPEQFDVVLM